MRNPKLAYILVRHSHHVFGPLILEVPDLSQ